jgi:hypothetical protein
MVVVFPPGAGAVLGEGAIDDTIRIACLKQDDVAACGAIEAAVVRCFSLELKPFWLEV